MQFEKKEKSAVLNDTSSCARIRYNRLDPKTRPSQNFSPF